MDDHATVICRECGSSFDAAMRLSRRALASSRLMFLVEICPYCEQARSYAPADYHFSVTA